MEKLNWRIVMSPSGQTGHEHGCREKVKGWVEPVNRRLHGLEYMSKINIYKIVESTLYNGRRKTP